MTVAAKKKVIRRSRNGAPRSAPSREEHIVAEATSFFADVGFNGQTRELAKRIGITQPALYKHFANKGELLEKVYQTVYLSRWNPYWESILEDETKPLGDRLTAFYLDYARAIVDYNWIRITMQAALGGNDLTKRYVTLVGDRIVTRVCHAVRQHVGLKKIADSKLSPRELQLVWNLQGSLIYLAIRQHVYGLAPLQPLETSVRDMVTAFVGGAPQAFAAIAKTNRRSVPAMPPE